MGGHGGYGPSCSGIFCSVFFCGSFFGIAAFILFVVAFGVAAISSPFDILLKISLIIGVIGIILCVISMIAAILYCVLDEPANILVSNISWSLQNIVLFISFPVGIILAVGFFSLKPSLDVVLFTRPYEGVETAADWIAQTQKKMSLSGVLLIIGFVFVTLPIICYVFFLVLTIIVSNDNTSNNMKDVEYEALRMWFDAMVFAVVQLLCGLILFLPLRLLGRAGLAPFGFVGLKDSTYSGLCILGIVVMALGAVNIVVAGMSYNIFHEESFVYEHCLKTPLSVVFLILGAIGCVASVAILVYASMVLTERTKAESELETFCTADEGLSAHCGELLTRFKFNMCIGSGDDHCEDGYTMEVLQEKMLASTRGWMGFMGFACMFLAFVNLGISSLVCSWNRFCRSPTKY